MSDLPTPGSVWGVPDQPATWVLILTADDTLISGRRFSRFEPCYELKTSQWNPVNGAVDITAIVQRDAELTRKLLRCYSVSDAELITSEVMKPRLEEILNEPFTVDWLVDIGFINVESSVYRIDEFHVWQAFAGWRCSFPQVATDRCKPIATKRDVLKWLDVLGIQPTKAGT